MNLIPYRSTFRAIVAPDQKNPDIDWCQTQRHEEEARKGAESRCCRLAETENAVRKSLAGER